MNEEPAEAVCCGFFLVSLCRVADIAEGRGQKAEGKRLSSQGFSIWRESRVALATAIPVQEKAIASPSSTRPGTTANYGLGGVRSLMSNTNRVALS